MSHMANVKKDNVSNFSPLISFLSRLFWAQTFSIRSVSNLCVFYALHENFFWREKCGIDFVIRFIEAKHSNLFRLWVCAVGEQALVCAPPQRPSSLPSFFPCCTILCSIGALLVLFWWLAVLSAALFWQLLLRSSSRSHIWAGAMWAQTIFWLTGESTN